MNYAPRLADATDTFPEAVSTWLCWPATKATASAATIVRPINTFFI